MKRDMDLVREILLALEKVPADGEVELDLEGYSQEEISNHVKLLSEEGLVEAQDHSGYRDNWQPECLTWKGHDFLEVSRDQERWEKATKIAREEVGWITLDSLKAILTKLATETAYAENVRTSSDQTPPEIAESLERFRRDHPDARKVAFLMMRFGKTKAHENIVAGIRCALDPQEVTVVRADDKQYHDDLFPNVLTYVYGCSFGIAIFERIETEQFNPNVALEVGYMFALKKDVCLLKDRTLNTLQADLVGKLYKEFDPLDPIATIPKELSRWLRDKGLGRGTEPRAQAGG